MITRRPSASRGLTRISWLESRHTFSFREYRDPDHQGFGCLKVLNEDCIAPGMGYGKHPRRNVELVFLVLEGRVFFRDSLGNDMELAEDEVYRVTAGTGVLVSCENASTTDSARLLELWIEPARFDVAPECRRLTAPPEREAGRLHLLISPTGRDQSLTIAQDAELYLGIIEPGQSVIQALSPGRRAWVQLIDGSIELNGIRLEAGDGAAIEEEDQLHFVASKRGKFLFIDLP